jgi:methionine-rich copper-binding protein CopC
MTFMHRNRRVRAVSVAVLLGLFALPVTVLGHAELETVTPADGATVAELTEIVMTFSQDLDPAKSSIVLVDSAGSTVLTGGDVDSSDKTIMTLAVTDLVAGDYEIRWTSASADDGDLERGTTTFTFAPPNPTESDLLPTPSPSASPTPAPSPSAVPSPSPSAAPSPSGSGTPTASTSDVLIPIVVAVVVIAALGAWLLRGRARGGGPA